MSEDKRINETAREPDAGGPAIERSRFMQEIVMGTVRSGPAYHPIFDKFDSQHVTQFLKDSFESDAARQRTHRSNRWFRLAYVGLGVALFIFLTLSLLPDRSDLHFQILQGLGLFGSGLAGGYGIRSYQDSK